jgi:3-keto-5-aminohexanoate cleavage enzyme
MISKGVLAKSNAELVTRAAEIIGEYDRHVASVKEAREILGLKPAKAVRAA